MTIAEFKALFPKFAEITDDQFNYYYNYCLSLHNVSAFSSSSLFDNMVAHFIAHCLVMSSPQKDESAIVTSEKVGDIALSYAVASEYDSTYFGRQYKKLKKVGLGVLSFPLGASQ